MNSTCATSKRFGPEHVSSSAPIFGQRLTFQTFSGGVHLHQYELVPGGWSHEALNSWRIAFQQTGSPRVIRKVGNQCERQLRPAGTISINPPSPQSWTWDCKMRVALLFISQDVIGEVLSEAGMDRRYGELVTPLVIDDPLIKQTIVEMLSEGAMSSTLSRLLIDTAGRHVAAHLLARYSQGERRKEAASMAEWKVKRVVDYIERSLGQDIGLEELSSNVDMTPDYFCRAFRKAVGMPPYRYLLGRRIERAKELLRSTDQGLTEIALEVGFSSHSHFTSAFRAAVGYTPANYRKSHPALDS